VPRRRSRPRPITGRAAPRSNLPTPSDEEFARDQIIVELEEGATQADLAALNRRNDAHTEENLPRSDVNVVDLPSDLAVGEAVQRYEASPDVEYAEPDYLLQPAQTVSPSDPYYSRLYGLNNTGQTNGTPDADVDAKEAWGTTTGSWTTVVAVIDEGVDINHPALKNNIWVNTDEVPSNGVDDDRNGYVDDRNGYDFANDDASVYDPDPVNGRGDEHGTHVAGTIAAQGNNGVAGVNWQAGIMALKFLGPNGGYTSDAVEALNYAVANGARISNNSWGGGGYSQALRDAINRADASGHLFVAAAGNDGVNNDATPHYPSSYSSANIISVAATDDEDALASFSNFGATSVDLAAPGVNILSTLPGNRYGSYSGTSMATPHVTGAAASSRARTPARPTRS
jgi:thermitase